MITFLLNRKRNKKKDKKNTCLEMVTRTYLEPKITDAVLKLSSKFKNTKNDTFCSSVLVNKGDIYNTLVDIIKNSDELPRSDIIENKLDIDKRERLKHYKRLVEKGYLIQNNTVYKINPNLKE
ncbi:MAG: hypothetical protein EH224_15110 [Calditrichaeota bacterium]|nr:MAG: hypothetical protein EH224_15110 [Calditrichota bacterium]